MREHFTKKTVAASDNITLVNDLGNRIPDKSWMLYLLEIFNTQNAACELNLICQFDNQNYFEAIFQGRNQYRFKHVIPILNHAYQRQIILNQQDSLISYLLTDKKSNQSEIFDLSLDNNSLQTRSNFKYEASNQFTGIEWWNKVGSFPYPIRYSVEISQLLFGFNDVTSSHPTSITFIPYDTLIPHREGMARQYPISFIKPRINDDDGCIFYGISDGVCTSGLRFSIYLGSVNPSYSEIGLR